MTYNYFTIGIIISILASSIYSFINKKFYYSSIFYPYGVRNTVGILKLFQSSLVHFNITHLLINLGVFYVFGGELERILKALGLSQCYLLVIYLTSVAGGGLLEYLIYRKNQSFSTIGASNGIYGIMAVTLLLEPFKVIKFIPGVMLSNLYLIPIIWILTLINFKMKDNQINYCGHLGGIISGVFAFLFIKIAE